MARLFTPTSLHLLPLSSLLLLHIPFFLDPFRLFAPLLDHGNVCGSQLHRYFLESIFFMSLFSSGSTFGFGTGVCSLESSKLAIWHFFLHVCKEHIMDFALLFPQLRNGTGRALNRILLARLLSWMDLCMYGAEKRLGFCSSAGFCFLTGLGTFGAELTQAYTTFTE